MNINRNNYEQFFILYVDNELNVEERQSVEEFVAANPDLQTELDMFREVVLQPEPEIVFSAKHTLLKNSSPVNEENFEEYVVLYGDDELTKEDKEFVEQFVYRNPQHQATFELIQMARLIPDNDVVYTNKEELFRYEKKGGAIISMQWMRAAAAAVILLFMGGLGWMYMNDKQDQVIPSDGSAIYSQVTPNEAGVSKSSDTKIENQGNDSSGAIDEQNNSDKNNSDRINSDKNNSKLTNSYQGKEVANKPSSSVVLASVSEKSSKKVQITSNKEEPSYVTTTEHAKDGKGNEGQAVIIDNAVVSRTETVKQGIDEPIGIDQLKGMNAVGSAVNAGPELQVMQVSNSIEYVNNEPTNNRNKLFRGLVRKATRIIEKSTSIETGNKERVVQVAGIQIAI